MKAFFGIRREFFFTINDGWEPDRLHVLDVEQALGRRLLGPLGALE